MNSCAIKKVVCGFVIISIITGLYAGREHSVKRDIVDASVFSINKSRKIEGEPECILFSTLDDANTIINKIVDDINLVGEHGYVGLESPSLSNTKIIAKLIEVAQRGAAVRVFVNDPFRSEQLNETYERLEKEKIKVIKFSGLHAKRIVIAKNIPAQPHDKIIYLGSLNMNESSPYNIEVMVRCTDQLLFKKSFADQNRRINGNVYEVAEEPVNFISRAIISSGDPQAISAKKQFIEDFSWCSHPHDYLYLAIYTIDDQDIVNSLIQVKKRSNKPIKVVVDGKQKEGALKELVLNGVDVYVFNKDKLKKNSWNYPISLHMKVMLRQCNQQGLAFISTANFTSTGRDTINYDLWEPCSSIFSEQLKRILDTIIQQSEKLNPEEFKPRSTDGTPLAMGQRILELMVNKDSAFENTDEILRLIRAGADLLVSDRNGATALLKAVANDHDEVALVLINEGATVNQKTNDFETPLYIAATHGNVSIVQALVDAGIALTLNFADQFGNTPLFRAITGNHVDIVKILLEAGADTNLPGDYREATRSFAAGGTPPLLKAVATKNVMLVELLIKSGAQLEVKDREGFTAFLRAFYDKNIPMIQTLARAGANLNIRNPKTGKTALIEAVEKSDLVLVKVLLEAGADLNATDKYRKTVFDYRKIDPVIKDILDTIKFVQENPASL